MNKTRDSPWYSARVGDPCRMPCRVRKEVWLEHPVGARIRRRKNENYPSLIFKKKSKISGGEVICAPSPKVMYYKARMFCLINY